MSGAVDARLLTRLRGLLGPGFLTHLDCGRLRRYLQAGRHLLHDGWVLHPDSPQERGRGRFYLLGNPRVGQCLELHPQRRLARLWTYDGPLRQLVQLDLATGRLTAGWVAERPEPNRYL